MKGKGSMAVSADDHPQQTDVLVIFGITGDLAKVMTFGSLYRLEQRNLLDCPIVGVAFDKWDTATLAAHARSAIEGTGISVDEPVFQRLIDRFSYVSGDFTAPETYQAVKQATRSAQHPAFYLEIPPSLFGPVVAQLSAAGLTEGARVIVEKPFGHDMASAATLNDALHEHLHEDQLFRIDHFLGKTPVEDILYLRFGNQMLEPVWNRKHIKAVEITMAENFGVADRGSFYDPVGALRDVVQNHLLQVLSLVAMEAPVGADAESVNDFKAAVFRAMPAANPQHYVRGQYRGYRDVTGVAADSQTETYCALRLEIDNWRWQGVPFFIRAGKALEERVTEVRVVFHRPPRIGLAAGHKPEANQLVLRIDPNPGARLRLQAKAATGSGMRPIHLDMQFADEGGDGPTPYEQLLTAAMRGDHSQFARQDAVAETWRIVQPLLDSPPPVIEYEPGSWGPNEAKQLLRGFDDWHNPWMPQ
jgi:glucose-6-phosphate 1-dehydrogenase